MSTLTVGIIRLPLILCDDETQIINGDKGTLLLSF